MSEAKNFPNFMKNKKFTDTRWLGNIKQSKSKEPHTEPFQHLKPEVESKLEGSRKQSEEPQAS